MDLNKISLDKLENYSKSIRDVEGKWLNTFVFRIPALRFMKTGAYTNSRAGSIAYKAYWDEELRRCVEGYEVNGVKITGHHYFYLNYSQIKVTTKVGRKTAVKETKFPDFWDGDYDFFWSLEIATNGICNENSLAPSSPSERSKWNKYHNIMEDIKYESIDNYEKYPEYNDAKAKRDDISRKVLDRLKLRVKPHLDYLDGGYNMIVGKSRRKGYSYKNGSISVNFYNTIRKSLTILAAFESKFLYPKGTMTMASNYLSFLNKSTAWGKKREYVNKVDHKKASYKKTVDDVEIEAGYQSEIMAITFKDNPDAARGKDALFMIYEEAGAFPNLKASFLATAAALEAGSYTTGTQVIFGTGGDMESGTVDFSEMFYNPEQYKIMPFHNIWDENAEESTCGFFHPVTWNMEGFYDEMGNSDIGGATKHENVERQKIIRKSSSSNAINQRVQEYPFGPSEAFLTVSSNDFPIVELRNRLNKITRDGSYLLKGKPVEIYKDENGKSTYRIDLSNKYHPIWSYENLPSDLAGSVVMFSEPVSTPPKGLYKIGFDPYRQNNSNSGKPSLAAIYVYKTNKIFSYDRDTIVAKYVGRLYSADDVNRVAQLLAEIYNAEIMHENEVTHVKSYFEKTRKLHLLAAQPDAVISKNIKNSTVARIYGIHMNEKLKDAGEKYIKQWLLTQRDIDSSGTILYNLDFIDDPGLLEELIKYNRKGNFDRVMSFMMIMFSLEEDAILGSPETTKVQLELAQDFEKLFSEMIRN